MDIRRIALVEDHALIAIGFRDLVEAQHRRGQGTGTPGTLDRRGISGQLCQIGIAASRPSHHR